jgi:molybdopterin synthase sulfur carrier subunit
MTATLRLPPVLRAEAAGARTVEVEGDTLRAALDDLVRHHPGLNGQIVGDGGELNPYVNVYVEGEDVRLRDGLATPLPEGATVIVLPAMAGGAAG